MTSNKTLFLLIIVSIFFLVVGLLYSSITKPNELEPIPNMTKENPQALNTDIDMSINYDEKTIELIMPVLEDNSQAYYHELMQKSLEAIGYTVIIHKDTPKPQHGFRQELNFCHLLD